MANDRIYREEQIWNLVFDEVLKALRVKLANPDESFEPIVVSTPKLTVVDCPTANEKKSHTFEDGVKKFFFNSGRRLTVIKFNWNEGDFDNGIVHEIDEGGDYSRAGLDLVGKTIYFSCDESNSKVEIEEWK